MTPKQTREALGLTQVQMAELMGISRRALQYAEAGKAGPYDFAYWLAGLALTHMPTRAKREMINRLKND